MISRDFAPSIDLSREAHTVVWRHPRNLRIWGKLARNPDAYRFGAVLTHLAQGNPEQAPSFPGRVEGLTEWPTWFAFLNPPSPEYGTTAGHAGFTKLRRIQEYCRNGAAPFSVFGFLFTILL
jgi:hypothetical protein